MARRNQGQSNDSGIFQKIGLLSDLTNAMSSEELREAFKGLGNNGDRLYEIFAEAVYEEIEFLMKGEQEEVPQVMADAAASAQQVYAAMHSLYSMFVSLSNTPAMAPLNLIAERMTGQTFNPGYQQHQPQGYQPPQYAPPQQTAGYPAQPRQQPAPEPQYEEPAPPPPRRAQQPRPQPAQQPPQQQPQPAPQQPQKRRQYATDPAQAPAPRPGPAQTNRPAVQQGHTDPAPTLPPRRNRITGLF